VEGNETHHYRDNIIKLLMEEGMTKSLKVLAIVSQILFCANVLASGSCDTPKPIYGKILAICGDQMVTYVGDQKLKVLGVNTTKSEFELAYCEEGGGRRSLNLQTNSEGYEFIREEENDKEKFRIWRMSGDFRMAGTDYDGKRVNVKCTDYEDNRTDIDYIY
jgi:hypothetical protein